MEYVVSELSTELYSREEAKEDPDSIAAPSFTSVKSREDLPCKACIDHQCVASRGVQANPCLNQQSGLCIADPAQSARGGQVGVGAKDVQSNAALQLRSEGPFLGVSKGQRSVAKAGHQMVVNTDGVLHGQRLVIWGKQRTGARTLANRAVSQEETPLGSAGE